MHSIELINVGRISAAGESPKSIIETATATTIGERA